MSRHFNYELDERRIKILLKENSMPYSDDVWNEYVSQTKPIVKSNKLPNFKPVSFAINKTTFLSIVFIVLLGSFTMIIAKFVDFDKSNPEDELVREVKPNPDNYKPIQASMATQPKEVAKPEVKPTVDSSSLATQPVITPTLAAPVENKPAPIITPPSNDQPKIAARPKAETPAIQPSKDTTNITQSSGKQGSKKKKKQVETLESKPLTTELPTTAPEEPELELK